MEYINDIWNHLQSMIDWIVFALVIASGYFIRVTPMFKNIGTTVKVLIISLGVTTIYTIATGLNLGVWIASFFLAFGFHSAILKLLERWLLPKKTGIGGEIPPDDDEEGGAI